MGKSYLKSTVDAHDRRVQKMYDANERMKELGIKSAHLVQGGSMSRIEYTPTPTSDWENKHPECKTDSILGGNFTKLSDAIVAITNGNLPTIIKFDAIGGEIRPKTQKFVEMTECTKQWKADVHKEVQKLSK